MSFIQLLDYAARPPIGKKNQWDRSGLSYGGARLYLIARAVENKELAEIENLRSLRDFLQQESV
jgi:hypothetical protein